MFNPFDKLKQIFKTELKDVNFINGIKISSDNKTQVTNNIFIIGDPKSLPPGTAHQVQTVIGEIYQDKVELLEEETSEKLADYTSKIATPENQSVIEFFKGRLNQEDMILLQSCLYLRTVFNNGGDYSLLKSQIVEKYHGKGASVSNLCTAGYFESLIIPTFQELERNTPLSNEVFQTIYSDIMTNYPFAVFINQRMNEGEVENMITKKIEANRKNGSMKLNIHGIGERNIEVIFKILTEIEKKLTITRKKIDQSGNAITVKLEFEPDNT